MSKLIYFKIVAVFVLVYIYIYTKKNTLIDQVNKNIFKTQAHCFFFHKYYHERERERKIIKRDC
jgi:hypothetical protein